MTNQWQSSHDDIGNIDSQSHAMYEPCIGTPVVSNGVYNNRLPYPPHEGENHFEGRHPNHNLRHSQSLPQGHTHSSQPGYFAGKEYSTPQQFNRQTQLSTPHRYETQSQAMEETHHYQTQSVQLEERRPRSVPSHTDPALSIRRGAHDRGEWRGGHGSRHSEMESEHDRRGQFALGHRGTRPISTAHTPQGGGSSSEHGTPLNGHLAETHASNSPHMPLTNSSKSSKPYTSSQRKQLRLEEKSYLKEVKRAIAEGRVPQVRLQQNNTGHIVQYKTQFLNALKLAALAIVPNADIDLKNPSTMQEIMSEVKRQFIIEKPLPEGLVQGFLQRLYKRNRSVYHRHWTLHGDQSKPDDCPSAAWLQLVDYWKSKEGSKECERNKANASAKKGSSVHFLALDSWCALLTIRSLSVLI